MTRAEDCINYEDIDTLSERIEGLRQARQEAADDEQSGYMRAPYDADDPRRAAYMTERNRLRAATGKPALKIREPR